MTKGILHSLYILTYQDSEILKILSIIISSYTYEQLIDYFSGKLNISNVNIVMVENNNNAIVKRFLLCDKQNSRLLIHVKSVGLTHIL